MVLLLLSSSSSLMLTTRRSNLFSTRRGGVFVMSFPMEPQGRWRTFHRHFPAPSTISTGTVARGKNARHLVSWLSTSPNQGPHQQRPKNYLTAEDLATNTSTGFPQRVYVSLSDSEEDVESMAANYVPGPEDFLDDDLEDGTFDGWPSPPLPSVSLARRLDVFNTVKKQSVPVPVQEQTPRPRSTPDKLDSSTNTTTSSFMAGLGDPVWNDDRDDDKEQLTSPARVIADTRISDTRTTISPTAKDNDNMLGLSREEFRSKFGFADESSLPWATRPSPAAVESSRMQDQLGLLQETLKNLEKQITTVNNGSPINLSSYKQVSQAIFGTPDESTSKDVLEAIAGSNILAKLILEYRQTQQQYKRLKKKEESYNNRKTTRMTTGSSKSNTPSTEPLLLVDTSSLIFRAYYSMPPMHRADGMPVSAVLGFCNLLNKMVLLPLLEGKQPRLVLCCDAPTPASGGPKTWRHEMYHPYKANRQEAPMDLIPQFPYFRLAAQAYGMTWIEAPGYEADDVIATLAHKALQEGLTTHIYSSDKDLMQLITNSTTMEQGGIIEMVEPSTMTRWNHDSVLEKWGVPSHQLGDVLALAGDTADNIPGVPGIGPKIAAQLLQQFGTLEELLSNLELVPQAKRREKLELYRDQAILSQRLVQLVRDLDWDQLSIDFPDPTETFQVPDRVADLKMQVMNPDRILRFYDQMGFVTIKERLLEQLQKRPRWQGSHAEAIGSMAKRKSSKWQSKDKVEVPKPEDYDNIPF